MEVEDVVRRCLALFNGIATTTTTIDRGRVEVAYQSMRVLHYLAQQDNESQAIRSMMGQAGAFATMARLLGAVAAAKAARTAEAASAASAAAASAAAASETAGAADDAGEEEAAVPNERRAEPGVRTTAANNTAAAAAAPEHDAGRGGIDAEAEDEEDEWAEVIDDEEEEDLVGLRRMDAGEGQGDGLLLALAKLQAETAGTLWSLCIAHPANKQKAGEVIPALVGLIKRETYEPTLRYADNQRQVLALGAAPYLVALLHSESASVRRSATGALWHLSSLPEARKPIINAGGLEPLVAVLAGPGIAVGVDSEDREDQKLNACLALGNLSMLPASSDDYDDLRDALTRSGCLEQIRLFVEQRDCRRFAMLNLVWTTLKPLVDLLEAEHEEVNELGCFLIACLSRTNQQTSKLFHEGAVSTLERLALRRDQPTVRQLARIALTNLGVNVIDEPQPSPSSSSSQGLGDDQDDLGRLLVSLKMERFREVFVKHDVTCDNIAYLNDEDLADMLPLGPRRQLSAYIATLRRARGDSEAPSRPPPPSCLSQSFLAATTPSQQDSNNPYSCLICCDAERSVCFVPCGHVVSCKVCARILVARGDVCIICRAPIAQTVVPFYV